MDFDAQGGPTYAHLAHASQQAWQGAEHTAAWNWQNPVRKKCEARIL